MPTVPSPAPPAPAAPVLVSVEKRKWDDSVSARSHARLVLREPGLLCWHTPAGTPRERPRSGRREVLEHDEVTLGGAGWWVATALVVDGDLAGYRVDAATPARIDPDGVLRFCDLDLDLHVDGRRVVLRDVGDFRRRAREMAYPAAAVRNAWSGMADALRRVERRAWPFDGWLSGRDLREGGLRGLMPAAGG